MHTRYAFLLVLIWCFNTQIIAQHEGIVLNAHSMVYHEAEDEVYVFGGATESEVTDQLYRLDENGLHPVGAQNGPEGRTFGAMVYNPLDQSILLFGGSKVLFGKGPDPSNLLNDTWIYKAGTWKRLSPSTSPRPKAEAVIAYDRSTNRIVLFGGYYIEGEKYVKLNDTWEFYDGDWHLASESGPSARNGVALTYDDSKSKIMLFGGSTVNRDYGSGTGETWEWASGAWTKLSVEQPENVFNANMVYDRRGSRLLRFGGWAGKSRIDELWQFKDNAWQQLQPQGELPAARNHSQMIIKRNGDILLFGGHDGQQVFGDLWIYRNEKWEQLLTTPPKMRVKNRH